MKLISAYIAGFGKFVNTSFDFNSDLIIIKENNGWGKTTLAEFIRCMLYGLDGGRTKSVRSNDRVRYEPWQSATYGGSLTFTYGGRTYRVERNFGKTPAQDSARVLDGNNMPCYEFGDKAERLGVMLFGMDSESYKKSVYIPQGEIETAGLQGDLKTRLLALLNTGGVESGGADQALEKLDAAERALRAKRRPAKGKLDEIDEQLTNLSAQKADCERYAETAVQLREGLKKLDADIAFYNEQIRKAEETLEYASRQNELAFKRENYGQVQAQLASSQAQRQQFAVFFNGVDPATVNLDGITRGVNEFYAVKEKLERTQTELNGLERQYQEKTALSTQADSLDKLVKSYEEILGGDDGGKNNNRGKKKTPKIKKFHVLTGFIGIVLAIVGAVLIDVSLVVGLIMLGVGLLAMLIVFLSLLPKREKPSKPNDKNDTPHDEVMEGRLREAKAEKQKVERMLAAYPADLEKRREALTDEKETLQAELTAREQAICKFLSNFRFEETYDYRAAVALLQNRIEGYKQINEQAAEYQTRLNNLEQDMQAPPPSEPVAYSSIGELRAQKESLTQKKEELLTRRARTVSDAEECERRADKDALIAEEERLLAEKERLEKRHRAILMAKEILLRARNSIATRYLIPVEEGCKAYMQFLHGDGAAVRFNAEGEPLREEQGKLREMGFYSAGMRELLGLSIRVALVDTVFNQEKPVLVLDDPFVNLDDEKTDKAKRLVKELTKRYQVLYMTCKKERKP
ncbi:MAG: AAA family ATPase [Clostridia bacterium]|nr:AAA family ATPase [Clostridia bacterium]